MSVLIAAAALTLTDEASTCIPTGGCLADTSGITFCRAGGQVSITSDGTLSSVSSWNLQSRLQTGSDHMCT